MSLCHVNNDWNQKWESIAFISFKNIQEIVVLEEAHSSVSHLKVKSWNALNKSLENFWNIRLKFLHLTGLKNFDQLTDEHDFFWWVSKWPIFDKTIEQKEAKRRVFRQEKHRTSH
jgi:hypothetical protein